MAGGAAGLLAARHLYSPRSGGILGRDCCNYLGGVLLGWMGAAVGAGTGAHLGNGRRGHVIAPLAASLAVFVAAGIVGDGDRLSERAEAFIPLVQIATAVVVETAVGRGRAGR